MSNVVIVGAQWGDEGKGKVVDLFTSWADVVVRYQGGANAGRSSTSSPPGPTWWCGTRGARTPGIRWWWAG